MAAFASLSDQRFFICRFYPSILASSTKFSVVRDDDLAEMVLALEMTVGVFRLGEGKDPIDRRLEPTGFDCAVHRLEHLPAADIKALDPEIPAQDWHRIERGHAGEKADHGDAASQ